MASWNAFLPSQEARAACISTDRAVGGAGRQELAIAGHCEARQLRVTAARRQADQAGRKCLGIDVHLVTSTHPVMCFAAQAVVFCCIWLQEQVLTPECVPAKAVIMLCSIPAVLQLSAP